MAYEPRTGGRTGQKWTGNKNVKQNVGRGSVRRGMYETFKSSPKLELKINFETGSPNTHTPTYTHTHTTPSSPSAAPS